MGIVRKQSSINTLTLLFAILVGGINTLFLYVYFLEVEYYGLVTFILSTAFILKPLMALGVNYSVVKFFSSYKTTLEKDRFLSTALWIPLLIIIPGAFFGSVFYNEVSNLLSAKNQLVKSYTTHIFLVAFATAYFEIFYAWARVHLKSIFGNVLKELFVRLCASALLGATAFGYITSVQFLDYLTGAYFLQMFLMLGYALYLYTPKFTLVLPTNFKEVLKYSLYIILAGSAATILIDIDKFMIPQKELIAQVAFYAVAVYIGSVIEIPGRAMAQIVQPLTAKAINEKDEVAILNLYKKSALNLFLVGGLIYVLVNTNIQYLYRLLPTQYTGGVLVVAFISTAKLYHMFLGNNGAIISNSNKYKILLPYGLGMAASVILLNYWLIDVLGINGAALATLLVVLVFNTIKLLYVKAQFGIHPIQKQTIYVLLLIVGCTLLFKNIHLSFHPIVNILLTSIFTSILYIGIAVHFKLSSDVCNAYQSIVNKLKVKS
ncbi:polysaccharide biosynthesis C-terminal domain-containing protein [Flavobacteriaceae bacterium]|nr:polysaccharide biosynthesis C-terminal domain-containing protein [Flavobacteriaceae bacterium]